MKTLFLYFRTTVNRSTLVGRAGRTNDDRVCVVVAFCACVAVVTRQPLKSPVPSSYMEPSSTRPEVVVVVVVWVNGRAVPAVVMMNCCGGCEEAPEGAVVNRNVVCCCCCCGLVVVAIRRI